MQPVDATLNNNLNNVFLNQSQAMGLNLLAGMVVSLMLLAQMSPLN